MRRFCLEEEKRRGGIHACLVPPQGADVLVCGTLELAYPLTGEAIRQAVAAAKEGKKCTVGWLGGLPFLGGSGGLGWVQALLLRRQRGRRQLPAFPQLGAEGL